MTQNSSRPSPFLPFFFSCKVLEANSKCWKSCEHRGRAYDSLGGHSGKQSFFSWHKGLLYHANQAKPGDAFPYTYFANNSHLINECRGCLLGESIFCEVRLASTWRFNALFTSQGCCNKLTPSGLDVLHGCTKITVSAKVFIWETLGKKIKFLCHFCIGCLHSLPVSHFRVQNQSQPMAGWVSLMLSQFCHRLIWSLCPCAHLNNAGQPLRVSLLFNSLCIACHLARCLHVSIWMETLWVGVALPVRDTEWRWLGFFYDDVL